MRRNIIIVILSVFIVVAIAYGQADHRTFPDGIVTYLITELYSKEGVSFDDKKVTNVGNLELDAIYGDEDEITIGDGADTVTLNPTTEVAFSDKNISNVGSIALDSITSDATDPIPVSYPLLLTHYYWVDEFDQGNAASAVDEKGPYEEFWTVGGTNENDCANFANGVGGVLELKTVNTGDNDSTWILGEPVIAVNSDPIVEFRFKVDNIVDAVAMVGLVEGSMDEITGAPDDDIFLVGLQEENGIDADHFVSVGNDNNGGADYDDLGVTIVNNTYAIIRFDLTDTEQPRVWVNGTEVAAASITATVQAGTTLMPYAHVQVLVGGPVQRTMTIDYIKIWQSRG